MPIAIDVVSDFVCPWCFIGTRRLAIALERKGLDAAVTYRPFLLDPAIPIEGVDLRERLRSKFGGDPEPMFSRVVAAARSSGIPLDFGKIRRYPSTLRAHAMMGRAQALGKGRTVAAALFDAYFLEGRDIGALDVLADIGACAGLDRDDVLRTLEDDRETAEARKQAAEAVASGIGGVPFFIFADRLAVSGAQPESVFERALGMATDAS